MGDGARPVIFASLLLDCRVFIYIYFAAESTRRRKYRTAAFFAFSPHKKHYHPVYIRLYYNNSITQLSSVLGKKHKKSATLWVFSQNAAIRRRGRRTSARMGNALPYGLRLRRREAFFRGVQRDCTDEQCSSLRARRSAAPLRMTDALRNDNSNCRRQFAP